jgi:hypothetical protein
MSTMKSTGAAAETAAPEQPAEQPQSTAKGKPAEKKPAKQPKYDDATKAVTKRAQAVRGRANAVAPITVTRVQALLEREGKTADDVVKSFKTIKEATAYAAGDKAVKTPALVAELGKAHDDPFGRGRGLAAICLAMREQTKS